MFPAKLYAQTQFSIALTPFTHTLSRSLLLSLFLSLSPSRSLSRRRLSSRHTSPTESSRGVLESMLAPNNNAVMGL